MAEAMVSDTAVTPLSHPLVPGAGLGMTCQRHGPVDADVVDMRCWFAGEAVHAAHSTNSQIHDRPIEAATCVDGL